MINKLIDDTIKVMNVKYNAKHFHFEIECIMPGHTAPNVYPLDKRFFPKHSPVQFLDEQVQVGETVQVWIKEEEVLKSEGWKDITKHTLSNPESPFKIGKGKKVYLGGAHKGLICLNEKFQPFVNIKGYRFSEKEIKCILRLDNLFSSKNAEIVTSRGAWVYNAEKQNLASPYGTFSNEEVTNLIDLMRQARLI